MRGNDMATKTAAAKRAAISGLLARAAIICYSGDK